jgi:hypothetical protein
MAWPLIVLLFLINLWLIGLGLNRKGGIYEVPFLVGSVFMGFVLPQLPALANDPLESSFPLDRMLIVSCLCALMTGVGWLVGQRPLQRGVHLVITERRLLWLALFLSLAGAYFYYQVSRLPPEIRLSTMPSGVMVMYSFLQRMLTCGFVIAVLCIARRPSLAACGTALFDLALLGDRILIGGRKGETTEALLAVLIAFWFYRGWTAPRLLSLVAVLLAAVSLNSTAAYREIVREKGSLDWQQISNIKVVDNFLEVLEHGGPETRNAIERMEFVAKTEAFDYGTFHWNVIVYNFVPAQIFGTAFKQSLQAYIDSPRYTAGYAPDLGSTETGMADAFGSYWYFGALKFFIIAYVLARLYCSAREGWVLPQILYIFGITAAMLSVSHHTQWLLSVYIQLAILLLPGLLLLRRRERAQTNQPIFTQLGRSPLPISQR